jgi:signal transduction histidine kinase
MEEDAAAPTMADPVNILLVDDQPAKLLTYETILGELGETLITASSGREALECLLRREIAVVLVDVCMPDLDGYELASMIRQHPRFRETSILFVSATLMTDFDRLRGYEVGGVDYLPVPVVPEILRAKVRVFADLYRKTRALETLNRDLEQRVADRTAALEATAAALQASDQRKDEFLATLAHELRGPLAPLSNNLEVLKRADDSADLRKAARESMERQLRHLVRLVDDLLDVGRIAGNKLALRTEQIELASVVGQSVETCRPFFEAAGHLLSVSVPDEAIDLIGDPVRLTQVINNLLNNACKYTPAGGRVGLTVWREGTDALVSVRDTGRGIPNEMLPKIFEMFTQVERSLERTQGGLGVGLSLVKHLVELHGGAVSANSDGEGRGSEFIVRLPALSAAAKRSGRRSQIVTPWTDDARGAIEPTPLRTSS